MSQVQSRRPEGLKLDAPQNERSSVPKQKIIVESGRSSDPFFIPARLSGEVYFLI